MLNSSKKCLNCIKFFESDEMSMTENWSQTPMIICELDMTDKNQLTINI